jgi:hypothetical protein
MSRVEEVIRVGATEVDRDGRSSLLSKVNKVTQLDFVCYERRRSPTHQSAVWHIAGN